MHGKAVCANAPSVPVTDVMSGCLVLILTNVRSHPTSCCREVKSVTCEMQKHVFALQTFVSRRLFQRLLRHSGDWRLARNGMKLSRCRILIPFFAPFFAGKRKRRSTSQRGSLSCAAGSNCFNKATNWIWTHGSGLPDEILTHY
jgi:hypothetical protein